MARGQPAARLAPGSGMLIVTTAHIMPRTPATLYHYTNADGLLSMLRSGRLWATDASYMNDPRELSYGYDLLEELVRAQPRLRTVRERLVRLIRTAVDDKIANGRVYVASFCRDPDLLSQWDRARLAHAARGRPAPPRLADAGVGAGALRQAQADPRAPHVVA
jgi:hypothetical protein